VNRTIKALGLAFIAVVAMSALSASAAQATPEFTCSTYPCTATGSSLSGAEKFTTEAGTVECDSHFLVEKYNATKEDITGPTSTVTVTPTYTNCKAFGFLSATVNVEGCDYVFHATEFVSAGDYKHHVDVVCPAGQSIKIVASTCKAEVGGQTGLTTAKTTNNAGGTVTVQPEVANISMTVTQDGFGCPFGGTGKKTGSYHGDVVISRVGGGSISVSGA